MEGCLGRLTAAAPGMSHLSNANPGTLCRASFITPAPDVHRMKAQGV